MSAAGTAFCDRPDPDRTGPIAILGDLQRTSLFERVVLRREQNDRARARLIDAVVSTSPRAVVLLGDLVCFGFRAWEWMPVDRLLQPLRQRETPVLPILGNHDTWAWATRGLRHHRRRFPRFAAGTWYTERFDSLRLIFLDSNRHRLGAAHWRAQCAWYETTLQSAEEEESVRGVVVLTHHPPFTNAQSVGESEHVQQAFLPGFLAHEKTLALISGHVHSYEHFIERGKHCIVQGAGGGPRVRLVEGASRRHLDQYEGPSPRPFCFSLLTETSTGARLEVRGFEEVEKPLRTLDVLELS